MSFYYFGCIWLILFLFKVVNLFLNYVMVLYIYIYIYMERERILYTKLWNYYSAFCYGAFNNMINPSRGQSFSKLCYVAFCILVNVDMRGHKYLHMKWIEKEGLTMSNHLFSFFSIFCLSNGSVRFLLILPHFKPQIKR